jgi:hypothetical protein
MASDAVEADSRILPFAGHRHCKETAGKAERELDGSSPTKKQ